MSLFQTVTCGMELSEHDVEDIFELMGVLGQYRADLIDKNDLRIACGRGTVYFIARENEGRDPRIIALAPLYVVHTGIQKEGFVDRVVVPTGRRNNGVGRGLVQAIIQYAKRKENEISCVRLTHPQHDASADSVFREHGFTLETSEAMYVWRKS